MLDAVDASEHLVCFPISAPSLPPALNNPSVVAEDPNEPAGVSGDEQRSSLCT